MNSSKIVANETNLEHGKKAGDRLEAIGLSKVYGRCDSAVRAVHDITVSFGDGEFVAIVGASGSGKSTLLHLLGTLDTPTAGKVIFDGRDLFHMSIGQRAQLRRQSFGFVFQFYNLVPILTVAENITLPVLMDGAKPDEQHVAELVDMLDIKDKLHTLPSKLSGGQQQRVAIARALAAKPSVVFADEPTGNLDSKAGKDIISLFQQTAQTFAQTMIIVTHDLEVAGHCKRVIEIQDGSIINDNGEAKQ